MSGKNGDSSPHEDSSGGKGDAVWDPQTDGPKPSKN